MFQNRKLQEHPNKSRKDLTQCLFAFDQFSFSKSSVLLWFWFFLCLSFSFVKDNFWFGVCIKEWGLKKKVQKNCACGNCVQNQIVVEVLKEIAITFKPCICDAKMCSRIIKRFYFYYCQTLIGMFNFDTPYILINTNFVNTGTNMP